MMRGMKGNVQLVVKTLEWGEIYPSKGNAKLVGFGIEEFGIEFKAGGNHNINTVFPVCNAMGYLSNSLRTGQGFSIECYISVDTREMVMFITDGISIILVDAANINKCAIVMIVMYLCLHSWGHG